MTFWRRWFRRTGTGVAAEAYGKYRLVEPIAEGRLSVLYRGEHARTGETVAVKVLTDYAGRVARKLSRKLHKPWEGARALELRHPHVVHTIDCGKERGTYYIVMEFLAGGTVSQLIHARAPSIEGQRVRVMREAAAGLHYVHSRGVIHRDVCLQNIMLDAQGAAKLIDFGVAAHRGDRIRNTGQRTGRPSHMAPELIRTNRFNERTDIFAFGVSLYEIATGRRPFAMRDETFETLSSVLNTETRPPRSLNPRVSERLEAIILRALDPQPARRFPSIALLLEHLERVGEDEL